MEDTIGAVRDASSDNVVSAFLDRLFDPIFSAYVFTTIFLPSGSIYGVNLKFPLYFLLLPLALRRFLQRNPTNTAMLAMVLAIPTLLSFWVVEGVINGFPSNGAVRQYTDIVLTLLMCWLAFLFCEGREAERLRFLGLVLNSEIATCLFKAGMILYALARGISVVEVVTTVSHAFGTGLMTMDLGAALGRIQFVSDGLIPICVFLVMRYRERMGIGPVRGFATIILLLLSVLVSFSRYFWGYTVVAFVLGLLLGKKDRFKAGLIALLAIVVLAALPALSILYSLRFSAGVAGSSDELRMSQAQALQEFFVEAPILGHGLGSYTTVLIRNDEGRHSYEMELLALAGQTGMVGITLFALILAFYYRRLFIRGPLSIPDRCGLGILLLIWLAAGLYNPLLEGAVASVTYASLATMSALTTTSPKQLPGGEPLADI